jgi:hypothetical protein
LDKQDIVIILGGLLKGAGNLCDETQFRYWIGPKIKQGLDAYNSYFETTGAEPILLPSGRCLKICRPKKHDDAVLDDAEMEVEVTSAEGMTTKLWLPGTSTVLRVKQAVEHDHGIKPSEGEGGGEERKKDVKCKGGDSGGGLNVIQNASNGKEREAGVHCGNKYREPGVKRPGFRSFRAGL